MRTSAIFKKLFYEIGEVMSTFFVSVYEINTESATVSILSYASERYRNQNKDRNTGGFNKMHVHFIL